MEVHIFDALARPALMDAVRQMRFQVYCVDEKYELESEHPLGRFKDDPWDSVATTYLVEDQGKYLASCRVVWDGWRPFPCEVHCPADSPLPPGPLAECSRIISPRANDKTGLRSTRMATFEMLAKVIEDMWFFGCNGTVGAVDDRFLRMLNRAGLPFEILGPPVEYHGIRRLVGFARSELKDPRWLPT